MDQVWRRWGGGWDGMRFESGVRVGRTGEEDCVWAEIVDVALSESNKKRTVAKL